MKKMILCVCVCSLAKIISMIYSGIRSGYTMLISEEGNAHRWCSWLLSGVEQLQCKKKKKRSKHNRASCLGIMCTSEKGTTEDRNHGDLTKCVSFLGFPGGSTKWFVDLYPTAMCVFCSHRMVVGRVQLWWLRWPSDLPTKMLTGSTSSTRCAWVANSCWR